MQKRRSDLSARAKPLLDSARSDAQGAWEHHNLPWMTVTSHREATIKMSHSSNLPPGEISAARIPRPKVGKLAQAKTGRFLLICFFDPNGVSTIYENISVWQYLSRHRIEIINLWPGRSATLATLRLPQSIELADFSGVIIHCTVSYSASNLYSLDLDLRRGFAEYDGLKILMKQDEQVYTNKISAYVKDKKFNLIITCLPEHEIRKVYPREAVGEVKFLTAFTGYMSPSLRELKMPLSVDRAIDLSYRGSLQPLEFGRLGFEKRKIAFDLNKRFQGDARFKVNISARWEDRILGADWLRFLGSSKAVLGTESGSNLFDFNGEVQKWCRRFEADRKDVDRYSEQVYLAAHELFLYKYEGNVNYAQVSPRHFEAAATRSAQILYEGEYSGIFLAGRHYFSLRRDLANVDALTDFLKDTRRQDEMTNCVYDEIVRSHSYSYEHFVERFDREVECLLPTRTKAMRDDSKLRSLQNGRKALILVPHRPTLDSRVLWFSAGLPQEFTICELSAFPKETETKDPTAEYVSDRLLRVTVDREHHDWDWVPATYSLSAAASPGIRAITSVFVAGSLPSAVLARTLGAIDAHADDLARFRWLCKHFVNTNGALIQAGRELGPVDLVVACDLETLPAALVLGSENGAFVVYDAHEYWPYSIGSFRHWETEYWSQIEKSLAIHAGLRATVSPPLARLMSDEYASEFLCVPNCVPRASTLPPSPAKPARSHVEFLYQGGFGPDRGLEDMISAWQYVPAEARLLVRGFEGDYKKSLLVLAGSLGLLNVSVFFAEVVPEEMVITVAQQSDVGLIPYQPKNINNKNCCPNKLSQYMAAGLPIVSNNLEFVSAVILENEIGVSVDFCDHQALAQVIGDLTRDENRRRSMGARAFRFFRESFNWETCSEAMYRAILAGVKRLPSGAEGGFDLSWIQNKRAMRRPPAGLGSAETFFPQTAEVWITEISRLNKVYPAEIQRNAEIYGKQITDYYGQLVHARGEATEAQARLSTLDRESSMLREQLGEQLVHARGEATEAQARLSALDRESSMLKEELARIRSSLPLRAYRLLRRSLGVAKRVAFRQ